MTQSQARLRVWHRGVAPTACLPAAHPTPLTSYPAPQAAHLFRAFDADRSGRLSIQEFVAAVDSVLHGGRRAQLELVFKIFDRDGGGSITRQELAAVVTDALHAEKLEARETEIAALCDAVFRDYDLDRGGALSFDEFEAWLGHEPAVASLLGLDKVFALWLDGKSCEPSGSGGARVAAPPKRDLRKRLKRLCVAAAPLARPAQFCRHMRCVARYLLS